MIRENNNNNALTKRDKMTENNDFSMSQTIDDAKIAFRNGQYEEASLIFQKYASQNNPEALFFLGNMCADGLGYEKDISKAKSLLQQSANLGYLPASYKLRQLNNAQVHFNWNEEERAKEVDRQTQITGELILQEKISNFETLFQEEKAEFGKNLALKGDAQAMYRFGYYLINSKSHDYTNGAFWLGRSAQKGYAPAQFELSKLYESGLGVNKDLLQSILWLKRSQEQGYLEASIRIALVYCDRKSDYFNPSEGISMLENLKEESGKVLVILAKIFIDGDIAPKDIERAKKYLLEAKKQEIVSALTTLGNLYITEGNFVEGVPLLKDAAEKNDVEAIFLLAHLYEEGIGVAKLEDKAAFLYDKAAEMGHSKAQYAFALLCRKQKGKEGEGLSRKWFYRAAQNGEMNAIYEYGLILKNEADKKVEADKLKEEPENPEHKVTWLTNQEEKPHFIEYKEAFSYLIRAAKEGISDAQYVVSQMYFEGLGVLLDNSLGIEWCKKAANNGHFEAQFKMAQMYDNGLIQDSTLEDAINWYQSAADNGSSRAKYFLALMYREGRGVLQNNTKAFELFLSAAQMGDVGAIYETGVHYHYGIGCEKDLRKAEYYLGLASNEGYEKAILELAELYVNSKDVSHKHIDLAIKLLQRELQREHAGGIYLLSNLYLTGKGTNKDINQGIELLEKAASLGHAKAQYDLGMLYFYGEILPKNYQLAVTYLRKASSLKLDCAQYMMGICTRDGLGTLVDYAKAFKYFKKAADHGYVKAYLDLGKMYQEGIGGVCNYKKALHYYKLLTNCHYDEAYELIADIYLEGNVQVKADINEAAYWFELGAKKNIGSCLYRLAILHIENLFSKSNLEEGLELLKRAVNFGYSKAQYYYAKLLIDGIYVPKSYQKAITFLQKASLQNDVKAATLLGKLYIKGEGCEKNPILASDLFLTAANHGDTEAQYELALLFKDGIGVPVSIFDAYIWSVLAVSGTEFYDKARNLRNELALKLSTSQIVHAQYVASDYFNHFQNNQIMN